MTVPWQRVSCSEYVARQSAHVPNTFIRHNKRFIFWHINKSEHLSGTTTSVLSAALSSFCWQRQFFHLTCFSFRLVTSHERPSKRDGFPTGLLVASLANKYAPVWLAVCCHNTAPGRTLTSFSLWISQQKLV